MVCLSTVFDMKLFRANWKQSENKIKPEDGFNDTEQKNFPTE